jgi:hypothetical protein
MSPKTMLMATSPAGGQQEVTILPLSTHHIPHPYSFHMHFEMADIMEKHMH